MLGCSQLISDQSGHLFHDWFPVNQRCVKFNAPQMVEKQSREGVEREGVSALSLSLSLSLSYIYIYIYLQLSHYTGSSFKASERFFKERVM